VADEAFLSRLLILIVVAIVITIAVYGVVGVIVKMDDVGLHLAEKPSKGSQRIGLALVAAMPRLLAAISFIGTLAMLWVGGHIFLVSLYEIGGHDGLLEGTGFGDALHAPYELVHHWEEEVRHAVGGAFGGLAGWLLNTVLSAVVGLVVGGIVLAVLKALGIGGGHGSEHASEDASGDGTKHDSEHAAEADPGPGAGAPEDSPNR
jgi:predicted DNA repair protein MutK